MTRTITKDAPSKFSRYRARKKQQGLKLVRLWVPDVNAPGFKQEAARQAAIINSAPDNAEIMAFIEAATAGLALEPYDWGSEGPPAWPDRPFDVEKSAR